MLLVVCSSLAVDRVIQVPEFRAGDVQRASGVSVQAGGKGSNVARVAAALSMPVVLIGFSGREDFDWMRRELAGSGVDGDIVVGYEGRTRVATIVADETGRHPTVINEETPPVADEAFRALVERVDRWLPSARGMVVTGSVATGLPASLPRDLVERGRVQGIPTVLDAAGEALRLGLASRPSLVKPNRAEFQSALAPGVGSPGLGSIDEIVRELEQGGVFGAVERVVVTLGAGGVVFRGADGIRTVLPPSVVARNPVGAGDAFAAGFVSVLMRGGSDDEALRIAVGAASADVETRLPGTVDACRVHELAAQVLIRKS